MHLTKATWLSVISGMGFNISAFANTSQHKIMVKPKNILLYGQEDRKGNLVGTVNFHLDYGGSRFLPVANQGTSDNFGCTTASLCSATYQMRLANHFYFVRYDFAVDNQPSTIVNEKIAQMTGNLLASLRMVPFPEYPAAVYQINLQFTNSVTGTISCPNIVLVKPSGVSNFSWYVFSNRYRQYTFFSEQGKSAPVPVICSVPGVGKREFSLAARSTNEFILERRP